MPNVLHHTNNRHSAKTRTTVFIVYPPHPCIVDWAPGWGYLVYWTLDDTKLLKLRISSQSVWRASHPVTSHPELFPYCIITTYNVFSSIWICRKCNNDVKVRQMKFHRY